MVNTKKSLSANVSARLGVLGTLLAFVMIIGMTLFVGVPDAYATSSVETQVMYRLYNPNSGEHFYTASEYERDRVYAAGWNYEGIGWTAPVKSDTPVYRLYSGTDHHYTTSVAECDMLVNAGWSYEGISWYSDDAHRVPLYRQFNPNVDPSASFNNSGSHNYTTSKVENDYLVSLGWREEGIGWYGVTDGTEFTGGTGASGADGSTGTTHVHNFNIPIIETVHHNAAYKSVVICDLCGVDITNADSANHSNYHRSLGETCTTHVQNVLVTPAYDGEDVIGYKCSCGAVL